MSLPALQPDPLSLQDVNEGTMHRAKTGSCLSAQLIGTKLSSRVQDAGIRPAIVAIQVADKVNNHHTSEVCATRYASSCTTDKILKTILIYSIITADSFIDVWNGGVYQLTLVSV